MEEPLQMAEAVRQACIAAALQAYEDAGLSGLCQRPLGICRGCHAWPESAPVGPGTACRLSCATVFSSGRGRTRTGPRRRGKPHSGSGTAQAMPQAEAPSASGTVPILSREMHSDGASRTSNPADPDPRARW